jgi:Right handed beta helix region
MSKRYVRFGSSCITVSLGMTVAGLILGIVVGLEPVSAATYFLSPAGNDSNTGLAQGSPWKTFRYVIPRLRPGDTLMLLDGTYNGSNSGYPVLSGVNGTAAQPITLKALNERKAHIQNDGRAISVTGANCSYLVLNGIQASSRDNSAANNYVGGAVEFRDCHHLTLKRLLVHHNNRYVNSHLISLLRVHDSLIEESEFYYFHRHGVMTKIGSRNTFRRLYCHSRGYGQISGGFQNKLGASWGSACVTLYPADNSIVENVIADATTGAVFDIQASGPTPADNNRFPGNIALNTYFGAVIRARSEPGATALAMPKNNTVTDFVAIGAKSAGIYMRGVRGQRCDHCMVLSNGPGIVVDVEPANPGDGVYSFSSANSLAIANRGNGVVVSPKIQTWTFSSPNSHANALNYYPSSSTRLVNAKSVEALLGTCRVWIPDASPMKKTGTGGKDIGTNLLYRYQNGVLTKVPLWNQSTGAFPHGALVPGLNNVAGQSLFDVHKRLNVNTNGCSFPAGYKGSPTTLAAPTNLSSS